MRPARHLETVSFMKMCFSVQRLVRAMKLPPSGTRALPVHGQHLNRGRARHAASCSTLHLEGKLGQTDASASPSGPQDVGCMPKVALWSRRSTSVPREEESRRWWQQQCYLQWREHTGQHISGLILERMQRRAN